MAYVNNILEGIEGGENYIQMLEGGISLPELIVIIFFW